MDAGFQLDFNVEVQLEAQFEAVLSHEVGLVAGSGVDALSRAEGLGGRGATHGDLAAHGARVGHRPVHGLRWRLDALKGLHLGDVGGVWVPESLAGLAGDGVGFEFVAFANRGHGLGGDAVAGFGFGGCLSLTLVLAASPARLRARARLVAWVVAVGHFGRRREFGVGAGGLLGALGWFGWCFVWR